jgi:putative hydrolase of the HAD superfamily
MPREPRAVVFDMDDTLYPYRQHKLGGFRAVARHLEMRYGLDGRMAYSRLLGAARGVNRGTELQACLGAVGLAEAVVGECVEIIYSHNPTLRLPDTSARVLMALRREGWRVGVLTNGPRSTQERKVRALRLSDHVDAIVYASTCGSGAGKPERAPFDTIVHDLGVPPSAAVMVGDDERCDVGGALAAGMQAIRCCVWVMGQPDTQAGAVADRLSRVPELAHALLEEASTRHAA